MAYKRGPKSGEQYVAKHSDDQYTPDQRDFLHRRTIPFLRHGTHFSLEHLLQETYLQGMRDAVEAMEIRTAAVAAES